MNENETRAVLTVSLLAAFPCFAVSSLLSLFTASIANGLSL